MQITSINYRYSSAMRRLVALFIDRMIIGFVVGWLAHPLWHFPFSWTDDFWTDSFNFSFSYLSYRFIKELVFLTYYSLMESSGYQGTIGKIIMGIRVTDLNGQAIALPKAILRNVGKYISGAIMGIGFLMIIWDSRKQGLHDKIADTLVVRS